MTSHTHRIGPLVSVMEFQQTWESLIERGLSFSQQDSCASSSVVITTVHCESKNEQGHERIEAPNETQCNSDKKEYSEENHTDIAFEDSDIR